MTSPTDHALRLPAWLSSLFFLALLGLVGLTAWQWRDGPPVSANLLQLLPSGAPGELEQLAEQRVQEPLNRDLMLLVHHADEDSAVALAKEVAGNLNASGLFAQIRRSVQADLPTGPAAKPSLRHPKSSSNSACSACSAHSKAPAWCRLKKTGSAWPT